MRCRTWGAAFAACAALLLIAAHSYPSSNSEAGRKYTIACQRLAELKKSEKKKKYRTYWLDCIRTFELIEKKYPASPSAGDACYARASVYHDLYRTSRLRRDLDESIQAYTRCQTTWPKHEKAPEALYQLVGIYKDDRKDAVSATTTYEKLSQLYPKSPWTGRARAKLGLAASAQPQPPKAATPVAKPRTAPPETAGTVKSIRHWSGGAYTRIVIDLDKPFTFQAHELKNPDRLSFDLRSARISDAVDKEPLSINDGILKQVRASQYDQDTVRVVLDLASLKSYVAFPLHDPERLVIDVNGESGETKPVAQPAEPVQGTHQKNGTSSESTPVVQTPPKPDANQNSDPKVPLSTQMGLKIKTICIDAGHGGHDPGAIGKNGLKEKAVTLDIAKRLAVLVKDRLGCNVIMTRDKDVFIRLENRPAIARIRGADLFVSIHINANRKRKTRGIETYIQGIQASDKEAMATAARENALTTKKLSELKSEIDRILKDLAGGSKDEDSLQLAYAVQTSLVENVKRLQPRIVNRPPKRAFFYVLLNTEMPSILAEVGYISNPDEEALLRKDSYRQGIAEALFQGIKKYVEGRAPQIAGM